MSVARRALPVALVLALIGLAIVLLGAPNEGGAADHLDAPGLTSPDGRTDLDINDVFAFAGANDSTVLAVTVHPLAEEGSQFAAWNEGAYQLNIDVDGDAKADIAYRATFSTDSSRAVVKRSERNGHGVTREQVAAGPTDTVISTDDGVHFFAGLRSDPFFFDLSGFLGTVEGVGDDALGDDPTDFFEDLNTLAIVLEIPDSHLNDGGPISVWATTLSYDGKWRQVDRMGRPAINTVVNSSGPIVNAATKAKVLYNRANPASDGLFTKAVVRALQAFSALDTEGPYSDGQAMALAGVLLPDVLPFDKASDLPAPLEGRALADDVIDVELRVVTGGDPLGLFDDRDADGGVNSDGVGPHDDYLSVFPYLGEPN